jgi:hypothetical protein
MVIPYLEVRMKSKTLVILSAVLLTALVSMSCLLFTNPTRTPQPEEPNFGPTGGPLKFEPDALLPAQAGVMYEAEIRITGNNTPAGDFSLSNGTLPAGLELVKVEGEDAATISGIPEETGTFTFTVSVWCFGTQVSGQTGEKEYNIVVKK